MEERFIRYGEMLKEAIEDPDATIMPEKIRVVWDSRIAWHLEDEEGRQFNPIEARPNEEIFFVRVQRGSAGTEGGCDEYHPNETYGN